MNQIIATSFEHETTLTPFLKNKLEDPRIFCYVGAFCVNEDYFYAVKNLKASGHDPEIFGYKTELSDEYFERLEHIGDVIFGIIYDDGPITKEVMELAYKESWPGLRWVPEEFKTKELCEKAVRKTLCGLYWVPEEFKTKELCEFAVKKLWHNLGDVPVALRTKELCEIAVEQSDRALEFVPENLKDALKN